MSNSVVSYQLQDQLGIIRIDNPPVNALSHNLRVGLMEALQQARSDASQALLILCQGRTFIAGTDITEFGKPPQAPHLPDVISAIENFPKPVIAGLHGNALGGGMEVALATRTDIGEGQAQERERFLECRNSPQAAAMQHVFCAERAAGKLADIPADTPNLPVNSIAIIGAGTMGGGIAMCFANAGIAVTLVETRQEFLDRGMGIIENNYATSVKRGRFSQAQADGCLQN